MVPEGKEGFGLLLCEDLLAAGIVGGVRKQEGVFPVFVEDGGGLGVEEEELLGVGGGDDEDLPA